MMEERLLHAKKEVVSLLLELQSHLSHCIEEGMLDETAHDHNELVDLIDEAKLASSWDDLEEVIALARRIEKEIITWDSFHGRSTLSLAWPSRLA